MNRLLSLLLMGAYYHNLEIVEAATISGQSKYLRESWIVGNRNPTSSQVLLIPPRGGGGKVSTKTQRTIPSYFTGEDAREYDTYAACLAATEGLRRIRDRQRLLDPLAARRQYVRDSKPLLETLGMTIDRFNAIGAQIAGDEALKEKIVHQAFLYRAASSVSTDRYPIPEEGVGSVSKSKLQNFCKSMAQVEGLRIIHAERLKALFRLDCDLPANLSDPAMLPLLHGPVREMVESFPVAAAGIVQQNGLECDEFNRMLAASRSNPIFRWKVKKQLKKLVSQ